MQQANMAHIICDSSDALLHNYTKKGTLTEAIAMESGMVIRNMSL